LGGAGPTPPKGAKNAYLFFTNAMRAEVKKDNPGATLPDLSKVLGKQWTEMDLSEKEPYTKMAEADKKRYDTELAEFKKNGGIIGEKKKRKPDKVSPSSPPATHLGRVSSSIAYYLLVSH
jgi:hypothetical protein